MKEEIKKEEVTTETVKLSVKVLTAISKWLKNKWFNFGYMAVSFILNEVAQGLGWGMVMLYFVLAAYTTHKGFK